MYESVTEYFPRLHTAIAEWLACVAWVCPLRMSGLRGRAVTADALLLCSLLVTFAVMEWQQAQGSLWMALMALGMGLMLLRICARYRLRAAALYIWAHAFLLAELAASIEWQINYYLLGSGVISAVGQTYICMTGVYALLFGALLMLRRRMEGRAETVVTMREALSAAGIAIGAFMISNVQFAFRDNLFFASSGDGVLYARTLVDIGAVIMLYANDEQRKEMALRYELDAMTRLLQRQYEQYQQFEANNEAMHRVYHDLKHQIAYLESETDGTKRMASLREMKEIIRTNESKVVTGNSVLDTLLTSKSLICAKEGILMTCFADASRIGFIDVMDVCSIFGNTIDNAIECERKVTEPDDKIIKVQVDVRGAFLLIRIDNFCESPVSFEGDTPVTTKEDKQMHGYGLKSVRRSVEKYQGHINVEQDGGWFTVTILIPLPERE